jgi:hypothetical protein
MSTPAIVRQPGGLMFKPWKSLASLLVWATIACASVVSATEQAQELVIVDAGLSLRVPPDPLRLPTSRESPDLLASLQALMDATRARPLELLMTPADIERSENGLDPRDLTFRISRHPLTGADLLGRPQWENLRPRYRATIEETIKTSNRALIQSYADKAYNDKLDEADRVRFDSFGPVGVHREDATSLRYSTVAVFDQGDQRAAVRGFSATVHVRDRLFLVQGTRYLERIDQVEGFAEDLAAFDAFVDSVIALNTAPEG